MRPLRKGEAVSLESDRKRIKELEDKMAQPETEIVRYADLIWAIDRLADALDVIEATKEVTDKDFDDADWAIEPIRKALRAYEEAK
jgi:hypothetical protein